MSVARIAALFIYPIKSCAGILVDAMRFDECGPIDDRRWMVVDAQGAFVTQRELPRLCWVRPARLAGGLRVLAPGMPALQVPGQGGALMDVWCWDHHGRGFDEGAEVAQWFSDYLGQAVRLVRFDPTRPRPVRMTGAVASVAQSPLTRFTDGFPLSVIARESLDALNVHFTHAGLSPLVAQHFRPHWVIEGLAPFAEDAIEFLHGAGESEPRVRVQLVTPSTCDALIEVDLQGGQRRPGILPHLARWRAHPERGGAPVFGWHALLSEGLHGTVRVGDVLHCSGRTACDLGLGDDGGTAQTSG